MEFGSLEGSWEMEVKVSPKRVRVEISSRRRVLGSWEAKRVRRGVKGDMVVPRARGGFVAMLREEVEGAKRGEEGAVDWLVE